MGDILQAFASPSSGGQGTGGPGGSVWSRGRRIGDTGTVNYDGWLEEEYNPLLDQESWIGTADSPGIVDKMRKGDAQVHATQLAVTLSVLSARWRIVPGDRTPEKAKHAALVHEILFNRHNWYNLLSNVLLMLPFGYSVFERVSYIDKWAGERWNMLSIEPRIQRTIRRWIEEDGRLVAIEQETTRGTFRIPAERILLFTHRREGNNYEGISALRAAYRHWKMKDHLLKLQTIAYERAAIPTIHVEAPVNATPEEMDAAHTWAEELRSNEKGHVVTKRKGREKQDGWTVEWITTKDVNIDPAPAIKEHDLQIARNMLLDMLNISEATRSSAALSQTTKDFFLTGLQSHVLYICDVFNKGSFWEFSSPIRQIVEQNFGSQDVYPELAGTNLQARSVENIGKAVEAIVSARGLDIETENHTREQLEYPRITEVQRDERKTEAGESAA